MAETEGTTTAERDLIPLQTPRGRIAMDAAYRIEALASRLRSEAHAGDDEHPFVVERYAMALEELAGVVISAIGDPNDIVGDIYSRLHGRPMQTTAA
jgi:hypothetical protein